MGESVYVSEKEREREREREKGRERERESTLLQGQKGLRVPNQELSTFEAIFHKIHLPHFAHGHLEGHCCCFMRLLFIEENIIMQEMEGR